MFHFFAIFELCAPRKKDLNQIMEQFSKLFWIEVFFLSYLVCSKQSICIQNDHRTVITILKLPR